MMQQGTISVQTENIFPIIKKFLYSDHEIFLRELVSNAVDACQKVKSLTVSGEINADTSALRVQVITDKTANTLTIRDNGIGMTAEEVDKYINQIAFSGAEEFVSKYKDAQIIGHFGLGFYSAFMVAKKVEITTLSQRTGSKAVTWSCDGSPNFEMSETEKLTAGTDIVLHLADDSLEFIEDSRIEEILNKYCKFMPVEIQFGTRTDRKDDPSGEKDENGFAKTIDVQIDNIINNTSPLWMKKPADLKDEDYLSFYRELYPMTFEEPLFHIHINVDFPFHLTGILYFPKMKNSFEIQKNKVQLYSNQVFITDEVKNILPDFLTLLHGVVDSPDIPLNVSRSYLQEDANVKKISAHITKKVADKLQSMFNNERADFEKKWDDINVFIQYGMLSDEKFYEKAKDFSLYKTTGDQYLTLEETKEKIQDTQKDKSGNTIALYANDRHEQHAFIAAAEERGYIVFEMNTPLTPHFISQLESKNPSLRFKRVDADVLDKLIEKENPLPSSLSEEQQKTLKSIIEGLIDTKIFNVQFENMSPTDAPFIVTQNEFMRRMKEQSAFGGNSFYGTLPESYTLSANSNHPVMEKILAGDDEGKETAKQTIDLALLAKGLLKGEALTTFVKRSYTLLG
ncbi:MAG: molecular chaperone HtpG [Crocinitomicaceae bacterium]|nr:molecular chaperone HtpG [Crocinitomicaceae bacterium]